MGPSRTPGHGIFKGVAELEPGCFMWVNQNGKGTEKAYWQLQSAEHPHSFDKTVEQVRELLLEALEARMRELFYLNITRFMPTLLDRKDRMSMGGLEARIPYCDHRLVEYAWNIPWSMKNHQGREKAILRLALATILPEAVINRKKSPYPKTHHPAYLEAMRRGVLAVLKDREEPLNRFADAAAVRAFAVSGKRLTVFPGSAS